MGGVFLQEVSTYGRCLIMGDGRCLLTGDVHLWEVSAYNRCPFMGGVCFRSQEVSFYRTFLLMESVCLQVSRTLLHLQS